MFELFGAFIYRMRGGMKPSFPRPVDQILFSLPYGVFAGVTYYDWLGFWWGLVVGLFVLAITTIAVAKGHGNSMDLGKFDREPEWYEKNPIMRKIKEKLPLYYYDSLGMAVSGLSYTLVCGLVTLNPLIALSGALKGPAYMIAEKAGAGTEGGELLTGAVLWGAVCYTIF